MRATMLALACFLFTSHGRPVAKMQPLEDHRALSSLLLSLNPVSARARAYSHATVVARTETPKMAPVTKVIKLAIEAGKATPAPPIGPALGAAGVNIMMFCKDYNARTADKAGQVIPVEITVYEDRTFSFILKTPPAAFLIKKAAKIQKGSGTPGGRDYKSAGEITMADVEEIAKIKLPDLNTDRLESAMETVKGTARSLGVEVVA